MKVLGKALINAAALSFFSFLFYQYTALSSRAEDDRRRSVVGEGSLIVATAITSSRHKFLGNHLHCRRRHPAVLIVGCPPYVRLQAKIRNECTRPM